jgi:hypothetical protein
MKSNRKTFVLVVMLSLALVACGGGADTDSVVATSVAQTQQISALETAAAGGAADPGQDSGEDAAEGVAEATELPSETPTITQTPTPDIAQLTLSQATNCREGPGVIYGFIITIQAGVLTEVVGVHAQGNDYVVVDYSGGNTCWLWLQYADKTDFNGYGLTAYNTPPTPTPTYTPTPSFDYEAEWTVWIDTYGPVTMVMDRTGNTVTGTYPRNGGTVTVTGTLSANGQVLSGTWTHSIGGTGPIQFQIKEGNPNQFVGNYNSGNFQFCGAKNGASQPSPCLWP